jgi:hypothetical protein
VPQQPAARVLTDPIPPPVLSTLPAAYLAARVDGPVDRATLGMPSRPPMEIVMGYSHESPEVSTIPAAFRVPRGTTPTGR